MKKFVFGLMILLGFAAVAQQDQAKVDEEVKGLLTTYLESLQTLTDSAKTSDQKKSAKKALKGMITSPFIRVVNDQFTSANDSIISFKNSGSFKRLTKSHGLFGRYIPNICLAYLIDTEIRVKYLLKLIKCNDNNFWP